MHMRKFPIATEIDGKQIRICLKAKVTSQLGFNISNDRKQKIN